MNQTFSENCSDTDDWNKVINKYRAIDNNRVEESAMKQRAVWLKLNILTDILKIV